ncbi:molybdopterin oxidoreductase family protein [Rariglobus hedericola]|uniref:Molybdopterin-dependent oxidoreductase n=2 Tax=Rariglobus hedericola TaxID=2597822 RepID=A0A556QSV7_9BACT|nr:molybdopterin-dependent oxidoreductase [Rariglobus hedericola]
MTTELVRHPSDFGLGIPQHPSRLTPASTTQSICGFCSTGCSLNIHRDASGQAINLSPDPAYPVNLGMACPKGWEALTPLAATDRLTTPLLRNKITGLLEPVSWPVALAAFVENFKRIQQTHGPHALSFLSTGQIVMEEMALLGALAKFGMGMLHVDSNTRQCMATSHVAYKQSFGFDAPPFSYADFEESDALIFIGANPCIAHPIMWQRVMMNKRKPEIIVIDPRRTETAVAATLHVPLLPKSDLTLLYGFAHLLIQRGAVQRDFIDAHTSNYPAFASFLAAFTPERVSTETGLPVETLHRVVEIIATKERVSFWWTMGVNQGHESTRTAQAIINLALMTGNIGRPGTGANSITGQCNAMGSRLFGNASSLLGGYDFANDAHRTHVAAILGIDAQKIPSEKSWAYDQIIDGIDSGAIKGLWVIATNTAHSWINQKRFPELRRKLEFMVVQDMYATTETAQMADLVLPAAGWGEKEGVFINSERRLGVSRKVSRAPGEALSDFAIFQLVAEAWGCGDMFRQWSSPEAAFRILRELTRGQPCNITGIEGYDHIQHSGGIQWPYPADSSSQLPALGSKLGSHRRLFTDGHFYTADQRAVFHFDEPRPMPEPPDKAYPFLLNTGRGSSAQWHTGSRTNKSDVLVKLAPTSLYVEINPADAARLGIANNDDVLVSSRRGDAEAFAVVTSTVQPGQLFMPMHFDAVNRLTFPSFDPHSRQPSYKACAVRLARS